MAGQAEVKGDELLGIAKKMNRELEELPLHSHSAIVEALRVCMQHRQIAMQRAEHERQVEMQQRELDQREEALKLERRQVELAQASEDRARATQMTAGPALVKQ